MTIYARLDGHDQYEESHRTDDSHYEPTHDLVTRTAAASEAG